jgi:hypothetical protein
MKISIEINGINFRFLPILDNHCSFFNTLRGNWSGQSQSQSFCRINDLYTVNTPSRPPGTLPLGEGKGWGWGLFNHKQRYFIHFSHFAITMGECVEKQIDLQSPDMTMIEFAR